MSLISTTVMAFSMSADAFAASVGKGTALRRPSLRHAMNIGFVFAAVETVTPIIGWLLGLAASNYIAAFDHWVAFVILGLVGGKMLVEGVQRNDAEEGGSRPHSLGMLILTAIGTSIDAMAVGVTLALLDVSIWLSAIAIGMATFTMATIGIMTGHYIGTRGGRIAEVLGGLCLIMIGTRILCQHLGLIG